MDAADKFALREEHLSVPADQAWALALLHWTRAAEEKLARRDAEGLLATEFSELGRRLLLFVLFRRLTTAARPALEAEVDERLRSLGGLLAYDVRLATKAQRAQAAGEVRAALEADIAPGVAAPGVVGGTCAPTCASGAANAPWDAHASIGMPGAAGVSLGSAPDTPAEAGPLARMPLLAPMLDGLVDQFVDMALELAGRLARDRRELARALFGGTDPGRVAYVSADGADAHCGGRMALMLTFEDGRRVLYKPHDCTPDALFGELVARWFADDLIVPRTLARDGYGWCEFIGRSPAADEGEVRAYFRRLGRVFALMQALGSTDLHYENWLACGTRPALVDLETILAPVPRMFSDAAEHPDGFDAGRDPFLEDLNRSLVPSCLLPDSRGGRQYCILLADGEGQACLPELDGRRVSVLGYEDELLAGFSEGYGRCLEARDELRAAVEGFAGATVRRLVRNTDYYARLLERLHGRRALASREEQGRIVARAEDFFVRHGAAHMLPIARFEATCLLRGDIPYFCARAEGHDLCGDGAGEGDVVMPGFFEHSAVEAAHERIDRLSEAERDFEAGILRESLCMALVRTPDDGRHDADAPEDKSEAEAPAASRAEIDERAETDAVADAVVGEGDDSESERGVGREGSHPTAGAGAPAGACLASDAPALLSPAAALTEAIALFEDIEARLLTGPSGARGWIARNGEQGALAIARPGLAQGTGGYGVLFAALADASGVPDDVRRRARELAELCLDRLELTLEGLERARTIPETAVPFGVTDGLGGVLVSLAHMGRHLHDDWSRNLAVRLLALLDRADIESAKQSDVYSGLAGLILGIDACAPLLAGDTAAAREAIRRAAARLLELRTLPDPTAGMPAAPSVGGTPGEAVGADAAQSPCTPPLWDTLGRGRPIGGAAHGMIGIAAALLAATELVGDSAFAGPALDALAFEHRTYSERLRTWPDFRTSARPDAAMHGLCSGAPGEGLALLACRAHLARMAPARTMADGPAAYPGAIEPAPIAIDLALAALDEDIARAIDACLTRDPAPRDHLCCGSASSVELLLEVARLGSAGPASPACVGAPPRTAGDAPVTALASSPAPETSPIPTCGPGAAGSSVPRSPLAFDPDLARRCRVRVAQLLAIGRARSWRLLPAGYRDVPDMSLLYGRAGIAYELLRFANPSLPRYCSSAIPT